MLDFRNSFTPLFVHSRCSLCSLLCNWAERCVSSVKWWRDIEKCYCTIVAKTTHLRHQKGRSLTTIILQPYIFVRASVNGLLSTRKDPFLCIEFQRLWHYKLLWFLNFENPGFTRKGKKRQLFWKILWLGWSAWPINTSKPRQFFRLWIYWVGVKLLL